MVMLLPTVFVNVAEVKAFATAVLPTVMVAPAVVTSSVNPPPMTATVLAPVPVILRSVVLLAVTEIAPAAESWNVSEVKPV